MIAEGQAPPGRKTFIYVNDRLEGNALGTIAAMMEGVETPAQLLNWQWGGLNVA